MFRKWIIVFLLPVVMFLSNVLPCYAESDKIGEYSVFVEQEVDLLDLSEVRNLIVLMKQQDNSGNLGVYILADWENQAPNTPTRRSEKDTVDYAFSKYEKSFGKQNGSVLVIDMATRYIEIINVGDNSKKINSYRAALITDNIYSYVSNGDYYFAARKGIEQMQKVLAGQKIPQGMKIICNIFFAIIISLILNFYLLKATSKLPKVSRKTLLKSADISYGIADEHFEYTSTEQHELELGSVEAIIKSKRFQQKLFHILFFIFQIILLIIKSAFSGSGGGSSGGGFSGGHSGGGGRSSGGHRF